MARQLNTDTVPIYSEVQPVNAGLSTLGGLTATTDNLIVSVASAWASRTPSQVRTTLGLVIGTDVQAYDADLTTWAGLTPTTVGQGLVTLSNPSAITFPRINADNTISARTAAQVLSDIGAQASGSYQPLDADLTSIASLTATTDNFLVSVASAWASRTPAQVKTTLSLDNVTNTSDANKPVSTAQQTALDLKANLSSPTFTGTLVIPGVTSSGSTSIDWSGNSGTFKTSTGANTLGGAVAVDAATTPSIILNSGKTNTGFFQVNGKTSGALKITAADAAAQTVTLNLAAQTTGAATLTIPDRVGASGTFAFIDVATLSSLTSIGTIGTGVWQGTVVGSTYGGTGINNAGRNLTINTNSGTIAFPGSGTTQTLPLNTSTVVGRVASVDIAATASATSTATLFTPTASGWFRVSIYLHITTTGTSPVAGPVTITYTEPDGSVAQSELMPLQSVTGTIVTTTVNNSTTTGTVNGSMVIYAKTGVAIQYAIAVSGTFGSGRYQAHLICEAL